MAESGGRAVESVVDAVTEMETGHHVADIQPGQRREKSERERESQRGQSERSERSVRSERREIR